MTLSNSLSAWRRRVLMMVGVAAITFTSSSVRATPALGQDPAPAAKPAEDPFQLNLDVPTLLIFQIKPERAADFQAVWDGIRAGLAKTAKPDLKDFIETLKPYRVELPAGSPVTVFVFKLDAPSKAFSYNAIKLMYYADPEAIKREDADALYKKWDGAIAGFSVWPLIKSGG